MIPLLPFIAPLSRQHDAWFCDIWGVMHDGEAGYAKAVEACKQFRRTGGVNGTGGRVILITNAPRPHYSVADQLHEFGVDEDCYDAIVSSGDVAQALIEQQQGRPIFHLGPTRDQPVIERAKIKPVALSDAEVMLVTGLMDDDVEGPEDYRALFEKALASGLSMICANPDLMVERGPRLVYCAGALAQLYEEMGGIVHYAGKPHLPIYQLAEKTLSELNGGTVTDRSRILCIGDGLKTDMPGAFGAGLSALFIASGLHVDGALETDQLEEMFVSLDGEPIGAMQALIWD